MLELKRVTQLAHGAGFDAFGVAKAVRLDDDARYLEQWLQCGFNGDMDYMNRNQEVRVNPLLLVPNSKTVMVGLLSYHKPQRQTTDAPYISESGLSKQDYHLVMKKYLLKLKNLISENYSSAFFSSTHQHLYCDSSPILERSWAVRAGLGVVGKNHQLINPTFGTYVHIGVLILNEEFDHYSVPIEEDYCAHCNRCVKACPTGALREPMFDARKCLSYLTIERKGSMPEQYKQISANYLYGCDCCATVCPLNHDVPTTVHHDLQSNEQLLSMTAADWQLTSRRQKLRLLHRLART